MFYWVLLLNDKREKRRQRYKEKTIKDDEREEIKELLIQSLETTKPKTVRELVSGLEAQEKSRESVLPIIREMEQNDAIILQEPLIEITPPPPARFRDYFFKRNYYSYEHWLVLSSVFLTLTLVLVDVRSGIFFYIRYVIIVFYLLILPGWSFTAAIFPELDDKLRFLERVAMAIGLSISVLVIVGLFINFTFRFSPVPIVITLSIFIVLCQAIATALRLKIARDGFIFKPKPDEEIMEN